MAVVPGRPVRACLDILAFILLILLVALQLGLIDYYYLTNLEEKWWWGWLVADALVLIILIALFVMAVRYNQRCMEEICTADAKLKYAWIGWFAYSLVLAGKIATCFRLFYGQLPPGQLDRNDKLFDDHLLRLCLALSALIFLLHLEAHHYTHILSSRQMYITYLTTAICLDILDTIAFLDLLWQALKENWDLKLWLEIVILALACVNFVLPTFTLAKLQFSKFPRKLLGEKIWAFLYVLLVNGPLLGFRIYLYILLEVPKQGTRYNVSLFTIKNVAMIYLAMREAWSRLHYWRQKRQNTGGSRGELTAGGAQDDEH